MSRPRKARWCRLSGEFWRSPKVRQLSLAAVGLLVKAWSYASDQATDGRVPLEMLEAWAKKDWPKLREELTRPITVTEKGVRRTCEPFLSIADGDDEASAHDWLKHNIAAADWDRKLAADRDRKAWVSDRKPDGMATDIRSDSELAPASFQGGALDERRETRDEREISDPITGDLDQVAREPSPVVGLDTVDTPLARLRRAFEKRWLAKRLPNGMGLGTYWPGFHKHADLAAERAQQFANDYARLERSLDGYFASTDPFVVTKAKWNFKGWANDPERFIGTRSEPTANAVEIMSRVPRITDRAERTGTE